MQHLGGGGKRAPGSGMSPRRPTSNARALGLATLDPGYEDLESCYAIPNHTYRCHLLPPMSVQKSGTSVPVCPLTYRFLLGTFRSGSDPLAPLLAEPVIHRTLQCNCIHTSEWATNVGRFFDRSPLTPSYVGVVQAPAVLQPLPAPQRRSARAGWPAHEFEDVRTLPIPLRGVQSGTAVASSCSGAAWPPTPGVCAV